MLKTSIIVKNKSGLHLRSASELSHIAERLTSDITIVAGNKKVNPKNILILMSAGIKKDTKIDIICEGENEEADLRIMLEAAETILGEGEE